MYFQKLWKDQGVNFRSMKKYFTLVGGCEDVAQN